MRYVCNALTVFSVLMPKGSVLSAEPHTINGVLKNNGSDGVNKLGPSGFSVGSPRNKGVYRMMANGSLGYDGAAVAEDRATLGSEPSAAAEPYGTGEISRFSGDFACFAHAVGLKALNPRLRPARGSGLVTLLRTPGGGSISTHGKARRTIFRLEGVISRPFITTLNNPTCFEHVSGTRSR